jgi:RNA polymerase sigma factor (sigma-70 family)
MQAWDELVRQWSDRLYYYLRRLIDHEQDAKNVLQDVWLHAFRGIGSVRSGARIAPWLYTLARRAAMNQFRREFGRREHRAGDELPAEPEDTGEDLLRLENVELIHFGLGKLALPEREVLTLYFLEDLAIQEIAELLAVPAGTVKSRLFKARRELRRTLEKEARTNEQSP